MIHTTAKEKDRPRPNLRLKPGIPDMNVAELLEHASEHAREYVAGQIADAAKKLDIEMDNPVTAETVIGILEQIESPTESESDDAFELFVQKAQREEAENYLKGLLESGNPIRRAFDQIAGQLRG